MPTKFRRISVLLSPELDKALERASDVSGISQSKLVSSCLEQNIELLNLTSDAIEKYQKGEEQDAEKYLESALELITKRFE